jgi:hypothetical protein
MNLLPREVSERPCVSSIRLGDAPIMRDVFHHPMQIAGPELHLPGRDDLERGIATRKVLISKFLAERSCVFPVHFSCAALRPDRTDVRRQAHLRPGEVCPRELTAEPG